MSYDPLTAVAGRLQSAVHSRQLGVGFTLRFLLPQAKQSKLSTFTPSTGIGPKVCINRKNRSVKPHRIIITFHARRRMVPSMLELSAVVRM
jgi:hypothetical protein